MLEVNPFRDAVSLEKYRFPPAPFQTGSVLEEGSTSSPIEIYRRKNVLHYSEATKECLKSLALKEDDPKEIEEFERQWRISDGFDVDYPPHDLAGAPFVVKDARDMKFFAPGLLELAYECVDIAIKRENSKKNSNLEFVELVKFNLDLPWGKMYYLTFKAKVKDGLPSVYQAKVFLPDDDDDDDDDEDDDDEEEEEKWEEKEDVEEDDEREEGEEEEEEEEEAEEEEEEEEEAEEEEDEEGEGKAGEPKVLIFRLKPSEYKEKKGRGKKKKKNVAREDAAAVVV